MGAFNIKILYLFSLHRQGLYEKGQGGDINTANRALQFKCKAGEKSVAKKEQLLYLQTSGVTFHFKCCLEKKLTRLDIKLKLSCTWKYVSMSSMSGLGLFLSRVYMDMTMPGVQKPHWEPWEEAIRCCTA